jgi:hypothetical protein
MHPGQRIPCQVVMNSRNALLQTTSLIERAQQRDECLMHSQSNKLNRKSATAKGIAPPDETISTCIRIVRKRQRQQQMEPQNMKRKDAIVSQVRSKPGAALLERFDKPRQRNPSRLGIGGACCVPACSSVSVPAIAALPQ